MKENGSCVVLQRSLPFFRDKCIHAQLESCHPVQSPTMSEEESGAAVDGGESRTLRSTSGLWQLSLSQEFSGTHAQEEWLLLASL